MGARYFKLGPVALLLGAGIVSGCGNNNNSGPPPTVSFTSPASATTINYGQTVALAWTSTNAGMCTASTAAGGGNFAGNQMINGSASVAPTGPGTVSYTLSCSGPGGTGTATTPAITVNPNILSTLSVANITTIGNTFISPDGNLADATGGGSNPYGLTIAPTAAGLIAGGDLIVCNFNGIGANVPNQGSGTTIVGLHPTAAANSGGNPYGIADDPSLLGCNALTQLPDDSISAAAFGANDNPLVSANGTVNNPFAADTFSGTWGEAYVPANATLGSPALYMSNVGGTIDRITLNGDAPLGFTEIAEGFCGAGSPGAIYAPSGLTYDSSIDTLYIVDTSSYSVVALANVSAIGQDGVEVDGNCSANGGVTPTPALQFTGISASSATVIATLGGFDAPISAALLSDGDLIVGNGDIDSANFSPNSYNEVFEISPALGFIGQAVQLDSSGTPGALFGIAATVDANGNQLVYFNDDNTSSVDLLTTQ